MWKILFSSFRKCYGLFGSELPLARYQPLKIQMFCWVSNFLYIYSQYFTKGNSKAYWTYHFLKELNKIFQVHLNILLKLWLIFCCYHQKIQERAIFDTLIAVTLGVNMIARQITPLISFIQIHFCIWRPSKFTSVGCTLYIMLWSPKYAFTCLR